MFRSSPGRPPPAAPGPHSPPYPAVGRVPVPPRSACFRSGAPEAVRERAAAAHGGTPARAGCIPPFAARKFSPKNEGDAPSLPDGLLFRLVIPPPPEGTAAIAHAPLTADRIPPAARSGSSACAAPRTSPGAAPRMRARFSDAAPAGGSPADVRRSAPGSPEAPDFRVGAPPAAEAENASKVLNFSGNAFRGVEIR